MEPIYRSSSFTTALRWQKLVTIKATQNKKKVCGTPEAARRWKQSWNTETIKIQIGNERIFKCTVIKPNVCLNVVGDLSKDWITFWKARIPKGLSSYWLHWLIFRRSFFDSKRVKKRLKNKKDKIKNLMVNCPTLQAVNMWNLSPGTVRDCTTIMSNSQSCRCLVKSDRFAKGTYIHEQSQ